MSNTEQESSRETISIRYRGSSTARIISRQSSAQSTRSLRFADKEPTYEHFEIPIEDIPRYTAEEIAEFNRYQREQSGFVDFGGVYEENEEEFGENISVPVLEGPAYTDDEILKFNLFHKMQSASTSLEFVYESDDEFCLSLSSRADVQKFHDLNSSTDGGTITAGTGICTPGILLATEKAKSKNNATSSILKKEPSLRDHGNISAEADPWDRTTGTGNVTNTADTSVQHLKQQVSHSKVHFPDDDTSQLDVR
jgi:hypothetical protein